MQLNKERTNVSELARELGIKVTLLYKWRKEYEEFGKGSLNLLLNWKNPRIGEKA